MKRDDEIIGASVVRIVKLPLLGYRLGITHGPLWRVRSEDEDGERFSFALRALIKEYVERQGIFLRVVPTEVGKNDSQLLTRLKDAGFHQLPPDRSQRTFMMDISPDLETIRMKTLHKKWREKLSRSMRNNLTVRIGTSNDYYDTFTELYEQMHSRKNFVAFRDMEDFRQIQNSLPEELKMKIGICYHEETPIASLMWSDIGDMGISILRGTGNQGLRLRGSYLLRWTMFEELKKKGCHSSDQGGADPLNNPGGYNFRTGTGAKEVFGIGRFDRCQGFFLRTAIKVIFFLWKTKKEMQLGWRRLKKRRQSK